MEAKFRSSNKGTRARLEVEVEHLLDTTNLEATVTRAAQTATPVLDKTKLVQEIAPTAGLANGIAELELDSQNGALVPAVLTGDTVSVSQNGTGLVSCTLK